MKTRWSGRRRALALVDALAVEERVGVQHARAGAHRGRVHVRALGVEVGGRQEVGLGRVHPPRVDAAAEEVPLDLRPEELPGLGVEGVEEGVGVAGADPVLEAGAQGRLVEEPLRPHRLEVLGAGVELPPDRDHEPGVSARGWRGPSRRGRGSARGRSGASPTRSPASRTSPARCCRRGSAASGSRPPRRGSAAASRSAGGSARGRRPSAASSAPRRSAAGSRRRTRSRSGP